MATIINTPPPEPQDGGLGLGVLLGIIVAAIAVIAIIYFFGISPRAVSTTPTTQPSAQNSGTPSTNPAPKNPLTDINGTNTP